MPVARGISLERIVGYFRDAHMDVAEITLAWANKVVAERRHKQTSAGTRHASSHNATTNAPRPRVRNRSRKGPAAINNSAAAGAPHAAPSSTASPAASPEQAATASA